MDPLLLQLYARIEAQRYLLAFVLATILGERSDGMEQAIDIKTKLLSMPTQPPGKPFGLDPTESDLLASLMDEAQLDIMDQVIVTLSQSPAPAR
jgi:hypothetical protein